MELLQGKTNRQALVSTLPLLQLPSLNAQMLYFFFKAIQFNYEINKFIFFSVGNLTVIRHTGMKHTVYEFLFFTFYIVHVRA